jgi:hypothetical protein
MRLVILSLVILVGLRAWQIGDFMEKQLAQLPRYPQDHPSIVFVERGYYAMDLVQNDPWLRKQPWIFVSQGKARDQALARRLFPDGGVFSSNEFGWTYAASK